MTNITKEIFLNSIDCLRRAWLMMREKEEGTVSDLSAAERMRMDEGIEIGRRARNLYPEGKLVDAKNIEKAPEITRCLIADNVVCVIFEATFRCGSLVTKADILKREWTNPEAIYYNA